MIATPLTMTIAEFCDQLSNKKIIINRDYQREEGVWPPAARSYLIDTILQSYPVPKLMLWQKVDLKTRQVVKEVVDGQQRSAAIRDFFYNKLRITGESSYRGFRFDDLDDEGQAKFVSYPLSLDILAGADEEDVRETFRRLNSYNVPLNKQELRHAKYIGAMKFFIIELSRRYSTLLTEAGAFNRRAVSRMKDAEFLAELILAVLNGIETTSQAKLEKLYKDNNGEEFPERDTVLHHLEKGFDALREMPDIYGTALMKPSNAYCLLLALAHFAESIPALEHITSELPSSPIDRDTQLFQISQLSIVARDAKKGEAEGDLEEFASACRAGTNTAATRVIRFRWLFQALTSHMSL
jgi:hypothetical protein